ncbi:MAG: hypothetical protein SP4CHLAM5_04040 [Chlamydiia bacterium]|nr:hypothetical protein [Chlamydiia bacterium]MCH9624150.1 hypothetical protein [Chlamydiia bacterium]
MADKVSSGRAAWVQKGVWIGGPPVLQKWKKVNGDVDVYTKLIDSITVLFRESGIYASDVNMEPRVLTRKQFKSNRSYQYYLVNGPYKCVCLTANLPIGKEFPPGFNRAVIDSIERLHKATLVKRSEQSLKDGTWVPIKDMPIEKLF